MTTETTFRLVQRARSVSRSRATRPREQWLLTGFVRCAGCRYMLRADHNARGFRTYICKAHHGMGRRLAPAYAGAAALEEFVSRAVLALDDAHVVSAMRSVAVVEARGQVEALREQVLRLVAQLRRSRHPQLVEPELEHAEDELEAAETHLADVEEREAARGGHARSLAEILGQGTEGGEAHGRGRVPRPGGATPRDRGPCSCCPRTLHWLASASRRRSRPDSWLCCCLSSEPSSISS